MEEHKNNLPVKLNFAPEQLTPQLVKAFFNKEVSRKDYQEVLKMLDNIKPTTENLKEVDGIMKQVAVVIKKLKQFAKDIASPYDKAHSTVLAGMTELLSAILEKVALIEAEKKAKNDELIANQTKANAEKARIEGIKNSITTFINNCTQFIGVATTNPQIVNIQKRVGTEKSKKGYYAEFYDELVSKCDALNDLINERKDHIRKSDQLSAAASDALKNNDAEAAAEIKEQQEQLESDMEENILRLQEEAFNQISNEIPTIVAEPVGESLKGRNYWRWEPIDLQKTLKKRPEFVILEPNRENIEVYMAENREQWKKDGKYEVLIDGIKFFIKKFL